MAETNTKICIVGLGYVGLPLAVQFSKKFSVVGFDVKQKRIDALKAGKDITGEIDKANLASAKIEFTCEPSKIKKCNFIIAAVPTPINDDKTPDLSFVKSASELIGKNLSAGSIVVFESTVYPGVTEEVCVPIMEKESGLKCGVDWKIGYSPERVNPGDKEHTIEKIVKVVSGMDKESSHKIAQVYGSIITAGVHVAPDIKTAEAAKVIENIQRDLNIALMNELSLIFEKMGINTKDVLEAAGTKWNFHKYSPGLVGGHCIGVDPYYLTFRAQELGYEPKVILAGRELNDSMAIHVADMVENGLKTANKAITGAKVLVLGLTFKENVPDMRNSKAADVVNDLKKRGAEVIAYEPLLEQDVVADHFGVKNVSIEDVKKVDAVVLINAHNAFKNITVDVLKQKCNPLVLVDVKGFYKENVGNNKKIVYKTL